MLELQEVTKVFGKGSVNEKTALDHLTLTVGDGEFLTIIGDNGAGKSTLMNCIAGAAPIDEGAILLDGKDLARQPEYRRAGCIGRVFQDPLRGTAFDMTIEENLSLALCKRRGCGLRPGISRKDRDVFREQLSRLEMGLEDRMRQKVKLLSGGQRQGLTLLMAVLSSPRLLLLDEHTAALDPAAARRVMELTNRFAREQRLTVLMITHNMKAALENGTRTILMREGRILLDVRGKERQAMTVDSLVSRFDIENDRMRLL